MTTDTFRCLCCRSDRATPHLHDCRDYYMQLPATVSYMRCSTCGLVQQSPVPADTSAWYAEYPMHQRRSAFADALRSIIMSGCYFDATQLASGSRLLDLGCGDGAYLAWSRRDGVQRVGFEPSTRHAAALTHRLGCPVYGAIDDLKRERAGTFDVVTMHYVLEHVTSLHDTFSLVHDLLRPGGTFYVLVPHIDSWEARLFQRRWHGLDPPRHVSFPDAGVLTRLAREHGFTLDRERRVPFPNGFAGSVPAALCGRYVHPLFVAMMPVAIGLAYLAPSAFRAYSLMRGGPSAKGQDAVEEHPLPHQQPRAS